MKEEIEQLKISLKEMTETADLRLAEIERVKRVNKQLTKENEEYVIKISNITRELLSRTDKLSKLLQRIKELQDIEEQHRILNGELRSELNKIKEDITKFLEN